MDVIRALVADDEPDAREGLLALLAGDPEVAVVQACRGGAETAAAIDQLHPDLVFLDIHMPQLSGLSVLSHVGFNRVPAVVFVTAYAEHALSAFEAHVLDYLLKPFSDARFADTLSRAKQRVREHRIAALGESMAALLGGGAPGEEREGGEPVRAPAAQPRPYLERIMVRTGRRVAVVRVDDIDWIEASDYYARLHVGARSYLVREAIGALESKLDPARFVRIHRSVIISLDRILALDPYVQGEHVVTLRDGTRLAISRRRRGAVERALGAPL